MKLLEPDTQIQSHGTSETKAFGMQQSRKAFQILSDLYSDKPLAIVRELGCNAWDSHCKIGNSDPFLIHLPNKLEPWLTIQDFGSGISHSDIYDIYAIYFASTKTNSNTEIGCLGLGSKSPYCYTDTYTITSVFNGVSSVYNAHFNDRGEPAISFMGSSITSDHNGVSIQIPIKESDFHLFIAAVKKAFRFFETKPTIVGGTLVWEDNKEIFSGNGWKSLNSLKNTGISVAIMGGVTYPIDAHQTDDRSFIQKAGLVIFFEMGELDFVPSREALSYDEHTKAAINQKIVEIKREFVENAQKVLDIKENIFDALAFVREYKNEYSFLSYANTAKMVFLWRGKDISDPTAYLSNEFKLSEAVVRHSFKPHSRKKFHQSVTSVPTLQSVWYINDVKRGASARVRQFVRTEVENSNNDFSITIFSEDDAKMYIDKGFPKDLFFKVSDLPKTTQSVSIINGVKTTTRKKFAIFTAIGGYKWESEEYDPSNAPTYYIEKSGRGSDFDIETENGVYIRNLEDLLRICKYLNISNNDICLVASGKVDTVVEDGMLSLADEIAKIDTYVDEQICANFIHYKSNGGFLNSLTQMFRNEQFKQLSDTNMFKQVFQSIVNDIKVFEKFPSIIQTCVLNRYNQNKDGVKMVPMQYVPDNNIMKIVMKYLFAASYHTMEIEDILTLVIENEK